MSRIKTGKDKNCEACGAIFYVPKCLLYIRCCSNKCANSFKVGRKLTKEHKAKLRGRKSWNSGNDSSVTKSCLVCSSSFKSRLKAMRKYCSHTCSGKARSGQKAYQWKQDRVEIEVNKRRHWSTDYRKWRTAVFTRDGYKCKISDADCCAYIEAHHILSWKEYPNLRFNINNGITLCRVHHPRKRTEEKRLSPYFQSLVSVSK